MRPGSLFDRLAPAIFVVVWSTGWIVAKYGVVSSDPLTFLSLRFAIAGVLLAAYAASAGAAWPRGPLAWLHGMVSGVLLHAVYLGGVWWAIRRGVPSSLSGLIAALQPLLAAALAPWLGRENVSPRQWLGVVLGFSGVIAALSPEFAGLRGHALEAVAAPILVNVGAMLGVTFGAFHQKRAVESADLRATAAAQYLGAFVVTAPLAFLTEPMRVGTDLTTFLAMAWSVLALSIGAISLLLILIRRDAVARSSALIYLIPPLVAVEAFLAFGERLAPIQLAGMAVTVAGVFLARRP